MMMLLALSGGWLIRRRQWGARRALKISEFTSAGCAGTAHIRSQQLERLFDLQLSTLSSGSLSPAQKVLASSSLDFWGEF